MAIEESPSIEMSASDSLTLAKTNCESIGGAEAAGSVENTTTRGVKLLPRPSHNADGTLKVQPNKSGPRSCAFCGTTKTPQWRAGPYANEHLLCDRCGKGFNRGTIKLPEDFAEDKCCISCGRRNSVCWRVGGRRFGTPSYCNDCGLKRNAKKHDGKPSDSFFDPLDKVHIRRHDDALLPPNMSLYAPAVTLSLAHHYNEFLALSSRIRQDVAYKGYGILCPCAVYPAVASYM